MAQVWKCVDCGYLTGDPKAAGDHERKHNGGELWEDTPRVLRSHLMDDLGE